MPQFVLFDYSLNAKVNSRGGITLGFRVIFGERHDLGCVRAGVHVLAGALGAAWPVWLMRRLGPSDRPAIVWARRVALVLIGGAFLFLVYDLYVDFRVLSDIERRARVVSLAFAVSETRARYAMHLVPGMGLYLVTTLIARYASPPRGA